MKRPPAIFSGSAASSAQFPGDGLMEVAFLGRSNVGKSSLLNALLGIKNLARVSSTPGRTRVINFYRVGETMYFVDLPGYGYANVPERMRRSWEGLVDSYLVDRAPIALCLLLLDSRHEPTDGDAMLRDFLDHRGLPYLIAATKADKLSRDQIGRNCAHLKANWGKNARAVIPVSTATGLGTDELWTKIREAARTRHEEPEYGHQTRRTR